ncbi:MAG TPA: hypothetical protein VFO71_04045 [Gemmatimonadales bacterium]|nr:hypothetical protein [Gemmatimonadales bacterium]
MGVAVLRDAAGTAPESVAAWRFARDLARAAVCDEEDANLWAAGTIGAISVAEESLDRPTERANARQVLGLLEAMLAGHGTS